MTPCTTTGSRITAYTSGCRCPACRAAWRDYSREWYRDVRTNGRPRTQPVRPVREHLSYLFAAGHTSGSVAAATGVDVKKILSIRKGLGRRVRCDTAERLLGMAVSDVVVGRHRVPAASVHPLLREMLDSGISHRDLSKALGLTSTRHLLRQRQVTSLTARKVHVLHALMARAGRFERGAQPTNAGSVTVGR